MARYIDADKLKWHYSWWKNTTNNEMRERARDFDAIIDIQPTIEATPVVHARWIKERGAYESYCKCSKCDYLGLSSTINSHYCPNCGSKMDGKEEKK